MAPEYVMRGNYSVKSIGRVQLRRHGAGDRHREEEHVSSTLEMEQQLLQHQLNQATIGTIRIECEGGSTVWD